MPRPYAACWLAGCVLIVTQVDAAPTADPWIIAGRVVAIADADTITILDRDKRQHRIRFNGIDAPEKKQLFSNRSRENLSRMVYDRNVRAECHKRDRYGPRSVQGARRLSER